MPPPRALGNYGDENGSRKRRGGELYDFLLKF